jgi:hypothetical protein
MKTTIACALALLAGCAGYAPTHVAVGNSES